MTIPSNHIRQIKVVSDLSPIFVENTVNSALDDGWKIASDLTVTTCGQYGVAYTILLTK